MTPEHRTALELVRDGDWNAAHRLVQDHSDKLSCMIHAHLHRIEGDLANATYWYERAGSTLPTDSTLLEWQRLWNMLPL